MIICWRHRGDISCWRHRGDIFIRDTAGQICPKQDFIVVPPPSNIVLVKRKTPNIGVHIEV